MIIFRQENTTASENKKPEELKSSDYQIEKTSRLLTTDTRKIVTALLLPKRH